MCTRDACRQSLTDRSDWGIGRPEVAAAPHWPVVVYFHRICPDAARYTEITPTQFNTALDVLTDHLEPLDLGSLETWNVIELTRRPSFVVTFDDGYVDTLQWARLALERRGLRAIWFAITGAAGQTVGGQPRLSWAQMNELQSGGHLIGSHSETHRCLAQVAPHELQAEISVSLRRIAQETGMRTPLFAYPYGRCPDAFADPGLIGFGTVRCRPAPWTESRHYIRRTYLPADRPALWRPLINQWSMQWHSSESAS